MVESLTCHHCNKTFNNKNSKKPRFCSAKCYHLSKVKPFKRLICQFCQKQFLYKGSRKKLFCSTDCYHRSSKLPLLIVKCGYCNKTFVKSDNKKSKRHYCSSKCFALSQIKPNVELICLFCHKKFTVTGADFTKKHRSKDQITCSNACRINYLNKITRRDEFGPFRRLYYRMKLSSSRHLRKFVNLTLTDLKEQWEKQHGICPYTGYKMQLPETSHSKVENPYWASIDRIDSNKGYEKGNIEFVCVSVNYAKNSFSRDIMMDFFTNLNGHQHKHESHEQLTL